MRRANHSRRRGAFTLVELLVVITILGILFALTAAAVVRALVKGDEAKQKSELAQLSTAVQSFKTHFGVSNLPSKFTVRTTYSPADADFAYLRSVWPRIGTLVSGNFNVTWPGVTAGSGLTFELDECLVLFLGGADGVSGFANDPVQPFVTTGANRSLLPPFFEFAQNRLDARGSGKLGYKDIYDVPYAYFSSVNGNDYPAQETPTALQAKYGKLRPFVLPTSTTNNLKFVNPNSFQIISAGRDQRYGFFNLTTPVSSMTPGSAAYLTKDNWVQWQSGTFTSTDSDTIPKNSAFDDVANFHSTQLGIAAN